MIREALKTVKNPSPPYCNVTSLKLQAQGLVDGGKIQKDVITNMDDFIKQVYRPEVLEASIKKK